MIGNDPEVEKELIEIFYESSEECLTALKANLTDETDEEFRTQSHAWKGMALNLGANELGRLCENGQRHEGMDEAGKTALVGEMEAEYNKVKDYLEKQG